MFESVRARLTLWYTGVLALILITFAFTAYFFLSSTLNRRTDRSLAEMSSAFASTLETEQRELESGETTSFPRDGAGNIVSDAAAVEAVSEYRLKDYQFVLYNDAGRLIAASPAFTSEGESPKAPVWQLTPVSSGIGALLRSFAGAPSGEVRNAGLSDGDDEALST